MDVACKFPMAMSPTSQLSMRHMVAPQVLLGSLGQVSLQGSITLLHLGSGSTVGHSQTNCRGWTSNWFFIGSIGVWTSRVLWWVFSHSFYYCFTTWSSTIDNWPLVRFVLVGQSMIPNIQPQNSSGKYPADHLSQFMSQKSAQTKGFPYVSINGGNGGTLLNHPFSWNFPL